MVADYLSRSSCKFDSEINDESEHFESRVYQMSEGDSDLTSHLREEQRRDPVISKALEEINENGAVLTGQLRKYSQMKIRFGLLYRGQKIVVPKSCREEVWRHVHGATHAGVQRTYGVGSFGGECFRMLRVSARPVWCV